ncbi:MAG: hypothetical protein ACJZZ7_01825 [Cytophagales bacterium]
MRHAGDYSLVCAVSSKLRWNYCRHRGTLEMMVMDADAGHVRVYEWDGSAYGFREGVT